MASKQGNAGTLRDSIERIAHVAFVAVWATLFGAAAGNASDFSEPWKRQDRALVIDAYEYNPIDWQKLAGDKRVVGVNCHHGSVTGDLEILRVSHEVEWEQVRLLGERKELAHFLLGRFALVDQRLDLAGVDHVGLGVAFAPLPGCAAASAQRTVRRRASGSSGRVTKTYRSR